jgi:hypothetical protein
MVDTWALRAHSRFGSEGSSPSLGTIRGVAQLVERSLWEREVVSSNLATPTSSVQINSSTLAIWQLKLLPLSPKVNV